MSPRIISEWEFSNRIQELLYRLGDNDIGSVTGPGRSGAIASVYASHILKVPFIPYGQVAPAYLGRLLIIDTAQETGATIRKASRKYAKYDHMVLTIYQEPPRVAFWYEAPKPQRYGHELLKGLGKRTVITMGWTK